jgi:DNA-binding transcriptional regulator GbsR (MarR family)
MSKEKVLATLKSNGEPMKAGEIAEVSGVDKKEVDKALKTLMTEELVNSPKRCFYEAK